MDLKSCLSKLTPHQYVVFLACRELWCGAETEIYMQSISDIVMLRPETVRHHMKALQRLDFVRYDNTNGVNTVLLWIRAAEQEKAPDLSWLKRGRLAVKLKGPDGIRHTVKRGDIRKFCEKNRLNRRCIYDILEGNRKQYKGWTVA